VVLWPKIVAWALFLGGCQVISGLDQIELTTSSAAAGGNGAGDGSGGAGLGGLGGLGGTGGTGGVSACEPGYLDIDRDGACEYQSPVTTDGMVLWLYPSVEEISKSAEGRVSEWRDRSAQRNDFTQNQNTSPFWVEGGLNGKPVVQFMGEHLRRDDFAADFSGGLSFATVVVRIAGRTPWDSIFDISVDDPLENLYLAQWGDDDELALGFGKGSNARTPAGSYLQDTPYVLLITMSGSSLSVRMNGTEVLDAGALPPIGPVTGMVLATNTHGDDPELSGPHEGVIAEVLMWERALTVAEGAAVEDHLVAEWQR
jgi:hypothetical protein